MSEKEYDGIIVGGGHNGLILQGYLCRAGLSVAVVERHLEIGGGLDAHEGTRSGYWHNIHSVNHRNVPALPWYKDLELDRFGQEYIRPEVAVAMLFRDKKALIWHNNDVEQTCASIARFSEKDSKTFRDFHHRFAPVVKNIIGPETYSPPMPAEKKRELLEKSEIGKAYYEFADRSINDVVQEVFENERVQAMVSYLFLLRGNELDAPGQGYIVPVACAGGINSTLSKGTSHRLGHVLHKMVVTYGGDIYDGNTAVEIIMENGRAAGVKLRDGRVLKARKFVATTLNPQQTFLELMDGDKIDPKLKDRAENFKYSPVTPVFTVHLALHERPMWAAAEWEPAVMKGWLIVMGVETPEDIYSLEKDCRAGRIPSRLQLIGGVPSVFDPTQAPPGKHVAWFWQVAPYNLKEGGPEHWDDILDEFCQKEVELIGEFAPNIKKETIVNQFGLSPLDIERHFPNMRGGDWMCGELGADQFLDKRPFPECSQYRTPIEGLYLAGSCCHPGGNITGAPGYNAAKIIVEDLGVERWWTPPDLEKIWGDLATS